MKRTLSFIAIKALCTDLKKFEKAHKGAYSITRSMSRAATPTITQSLNPLMDGLRRIKTQLENA